MSLNKEQIIERISPTLSTLLIEKGYISVVDVLMKTGRLSSRDYENWRHRKIRYLERVITGNINKINITIRAIQNYAKENELRPSKTIYRSWGQGRKEILQFSKTGDKNIEEAYSTHFVKSKESTN